MTDETRFIEPPTPATPAEIRCRISDHDPGSVAELHRHPYEETMLIRQGRARYSLGEEVVEAGAGELVIVPAGVWHGFEALGDEPLRQIGLGAADHAAVEWREAA